LTLDGSVRTLARDVADRTQEDNAPDELVAAPVAAPTVLVYQRLNRARAGR